MYKENPESMEETQYLAELVASKTYKDISEDAIEHAKTSFRDFVGLMLYGSTREIGQKLTAYVDTVDTANQSHIFGHGQSNAPNAAFVNGVTGHAVDYDDTFESVVIHPSCTTLPAALAATELLDKTGKNMLAGYVIGQEVLFRIGRAVSPSHWHQGWHSTGTIGVLGATAAAASVFQLDEKETLMALGLAGSSSSGMKKNIGTMGNPYHCGQAARMGVVSVLLAEKGVTASDAIMEGKYGYGNLYTNSNKYKPKRIIESRESWAIRDSGYKPYPSGVVTHAPMEALRRLLKNENLEKEEIKSVTVTVDEQVTDTIGIHDPKTALEAKGSYEFCLAAVLREGDPGIHEFTDEYVQDPQTQKQISKIAVEAIEDPFDGSIADETSYGGRVTVVTFDGRKIVEEETLAPGGPSNPIAEDRLENKYYICAKSVLPDDQAERVSKAIEQIDSPNGMDQFLAAVDQQ